MRYCFVFVLLMHLAQIVEASDNVKQVTPENEGVASYYHSRFHGRKSASGHKHSREDLTAAHRTLPFGTYVRVTNLKNDKSVIVRITDRGPYRRGRIIDVSEKAAEELDFIKSGITRVRIEVVPYSKEPIELELLSPSNPIPKLEIQEPQLDIRQLYQGISKT